MRADGPLLCETLARQKSALEYYNRFNPKAYPVSATVEDDYGNLGAIHRLKLCSVVSLSGCLEAKPSKLLK